MKRVGIISLMLIGIVATGLVVNGCGGRAKAVEGTVIAEFDWDGKQHITLEEMMQEISELAEYKQERYKEKEGLEEYMILMAESRIILCLAKDQKLDEEPEILKKVQSYLHELMVDRITEIEVDEKIMMTEEDFRLYYEEHKSDYIEDEQVRLTCVTLADEERAKEVLESIKGGKDIAEVAKELSDRDELTGPGANRNEPGNTNFFTRNGYPPTAKAFTDAAFSMEVGQMTDEVIEIEAQEQQYYIVFRKEEHKEARQQAFDEENVRRNVERSVENEKRDALMNNWLNELRDKSSTKTYIDRIPETPTEEEMDEEGHSEPETAPDEAASPEEEK